MPAANGQAAADSNRQLGEEDEEEEEETELSDLESEGVGPLPGVGGAEFGVSGEHGLVGGVPGTKA